MRMTNRLSKWSRHSSRVTCLLAACALVYACKDEFILDDEKPSFLNSSIYESLEQQGKYRTYLKLLADKDVNPEGMRPLTDVLGRTGSKTVFVANDSAWDVFFASNARLPEGNPWHFATSYENLSQAQKKLLIHTSMLNNAIVMENLASSQSDGTNSPTRGEYMRRYTDIEATDSITYVAPENLPKSYSKYEVDYWERFRAENGGKGIYMATDSTLPMMLHFTAEHMARNTIKDTDFQLFMGGRNGHTRATSDVHIYDAILKEKDGVCENGYVNVTEKPICPLTNMAEVIRTNGKTNIFSHILDRFSAPFYCNRITEAYKVLHPDFKDSIFTKRYFSNNNFSVKGGYVKRGANGEIPKFEPGPEGTYRTYNPYKETAPAELKGLTPALKFDPGWNGYYDEMDVRKDMAAIFVPSDEQMWHYFTESGGAELIAVYYTKTDETGAELPYTKPTTNEELFEQIDCIPLSTIEMLINNFMQRTFVGSVPSKWNKLTDDAMDPLFEDVSDAISKLDTSYICSNGVVYVLNKTCVPADYRSVTAPAVISKTNKIINAAIYGDFMKLNYYAYLKAMQSRFTFLLPSDAAMLYYYDPASMKSRTTRVICFKFAGGNTPVTATAKNYYGPYNYKTQNKELGTIGSTIGGTNGKIETSEVTNRLKDVLESHTIVHDGTNPLTHTGEVGQDFWGIPTTTELDEYYLSKNGNAVKVVRDASDNIIAFKGGFQLENERLEGIDKTTAAPGLIECKIEKPFLMDNGNTYVLDAPLIPTYRSVWSIFTNDADQKNQGSEFGGETPYSEFYDLCTADGYETEIIGCGLVDEKLKDTQRKSALKKFKIFVSDNGLDFNVQFFNNYRYTIFVPTNEAVREAIANGLPTWEEIREDFQKHRKPAMIENEDQTAWVINKDADGNIIYTDSLQTLEDSLRIAAKITYLTNFVRYHFADNSIFADKTILAPQEMVTSSYDKELELFCKLHVERAAGGSGTVLRVCDDVTWKKNGNSMVGSSPQPYATLDKIGDKDVRNILARDLSCSSQPVGVSMSKITISASSAAVIHSIDGCLNHTELINGRHDTTWESTINAKRYLKRYAIR